MADRFGRRAVMAAGNAVGFGFILALLAVATWQAALVVIFVFVCASFLAQPAYAASLAESTKAANKGGVFGTFFAFSFVGVAIGTLVGGYLPNPGHFELNIALAALVGVFAALVQALLMKETLPRETSSHKQRRLLSAKFSKYTWIVLLTTLVYYCASGMWSTLYAVFATERLGFSVSTFALMVAVGYVAAAIGAFVARRLSKRIGIRAMTMLSIMAAWPVIIPWIYVSDLVTSVVLFAAMYFLFAIDNVGLQVLMVNSAAENEKGKVVGLITTIAGLGSVAAPYVGSLLWVSVSPAFPLVASVAVGVASAFPLLLLPKLAENESGHVVTQN